MPWLSDSCTNILSSDWGIDLYKYRLDCLQCTQAGEARRNRSCVNLIIRNNNSTILVRNRLAMSLLSEDTKTTDNKNNKYEALHFILYQMSCFLIWLVWVWYWQNVSIDIITPFILADHESDMYMPRQWYFATFRIILKTGYEKQMF